MFKLEDTMTVKADNSDLKIDASTDVKDDVRCGVRTDEIEIEVDFFDVKIESNFDGENDEHEEVQGDDGGSEQHSQEQPGQNSDLL